MMAIQNATNRWAVAKYIVDPTAGLGDFTTITAAMAAASSGDVIAVRQGTYTEDFTIKAGVTLTSMGGSGKTPSVTIVGKITMTAAGTSTIYGCRLQTNSDFAIVVSGSAASVLNVDNCYLNISNNTGISFTSSNAGAQINIIKTDGNIGTTGIGCYASTSAGNLIFKNSTITNSGSSSTTSTNTSGYVGFLYSNTVFPIACSSTGTVSADYSTFNTQPINVVSIAYTTSSSSNIISMCRFDSGTASTITIGAGGTLYLVQCDIATSNTAAISGAGSIQYGGLRFSVSSNITVTTQSLYIEGPSATFGSTYSGGTNTLTVNNGSNTASSAATIACTTAGATAGDAKYTASTTTTTWGWGVDNSATSPSVDPFVISSGGTLGTTNVMEVATTGEINYPLQPAFLAINNGNIVNQTGNGTLFTLGSTRALVTIYDKNSDFYVGDGVGSPAVFTAPVTGRYFLSVTFYATLAGTATSSLAYIETSNRNYYANTYPNAQTNQSYTVTSVCDLDASDTAKFNMSLSGVGADTVRINGGALLVTYVSGQLLS